jgi:nucleotide-binding universal stress UspA family protein
MAYKDLLVHQNDENSSKRNLDVAIGLAQRFDAHLTGVHVLNYPTVPGMGQAEVPVEIIQQRYEEMRALAEERKKAFDARIGKDGVRGEFRVMEGDPVEAVALCAHYCDLAIVGQPDPDNPSLFDRVPEGLVMAAGRPVLVVPYTSTAADFGKRALVAWNGTREATRAVHDAMPFLSAAEAVFVFCVNPDDSGHIAGADLALHLSRHGVKAEPKHIVAPDLDVGDALLSTASDLDVDLIVMGAYGHSRLRELVLGGATRDLFNAMTCPVIFSH